jgi:hypothetical protein
MRYCKTLGKFQFKLAFAMLAVGAAVATGIGVTIAGAAEPAREAHDTYCIACHDTSVYTRDDRLARDYDALREQVDRWQSNISLSWSTEEIDRMASWLAKHYYQIPCPNQC